jgi:hypothetical protein
MRELHNSARGNVLDATLGHIQRWAVVQSLLVTSLQRLKVSNHFQRWNL